MKKILAYSLSALALATSALLYSRQLQLLRDQAADSFDLCQVLFRSTCDASLQSEYAVFLGLSRAGWGILYFSLVLLLLLLSSFLGKHFELQSATGLVLLTGFGGIISLALLIMMSMAYFPFCSICLLIHLFNLALFIFCIRAFPGSVKTFLGQIRQGLSFLIVGSKQGDSMAKWRLIAFGMVILFGISIYQRLVVEQKISPFYLADVPPTKELFTSFFDQQVIDIPITTADASLGSENAAVQLLIFSDFECPFCASFAEEVRRWASDYPNDIRIIFKHYPLSGACNSVMVDDLHPYACQAAVAAQAAHQQGQFWPFHDHLFQQDLSQADFLAWAEQLGLDVQQFAKDYHDEQTSNKVLEDIQLANSLGVDGTPAVYLNGRKVEDVQPQNLQLLVNELMKMGGK